MERALEKERNRRTERTARGGEASDSRRGARKRASFPHGDSTPVIGPLTLNARARAGDPPAAAGGGGGGTEGF